MLPEIHYRALPVFFVIAEGNAQCRIAGVQNIFAMAKRSDTFINEQLQHNVFCAVFSEGTIFRQVIFCTPDAFVACVSAGSEFELKAGSHFSKQGIGLQRRHRRHVLQIGHQ
jgi:hypothetical protein